MGRWRDIGKQAAGFVQDRVDVLFPCFLLGLCVAAYGLLIPQLGFYWDDWPMLWFLETLGSEGFQQVWSMDRPLVAPLFQLTTSVFGAVPWRWHVFALLTRWFSLLSFTWALNELWPDQKERTRWIILLFAIYPGFQQQSIALIYSHYFFILGLVGVSWAAMLSALHRKWPWAWSLLALSTGAYSLFSMEFFLGLELVRPLILWIGIQTYRRNASKPRTLLKRFVPYVALWLGYVLWRVMSVGFRAYQPVLLEDLREVPLSALGNLISMAGMDVFQAGVQAWWRACIPPTMATFGRMGTIATLLVAIATGGLVFGFLLLSRRELEVDEEGEKRWARQAGLIGAVMLFLGGWAFWIPSLDLALFFPWDRFTLGWMLGIGMLWVVLIDRLLQKAWLKSAGIALLVAAGVSAQVQAGISYQRAWEAEQRFFWSLRWRIPDLQQGTLLLTNEFPMDYVTDNSLTGVINLMYADDTPRGEMPFLMYDLNTRIGHGLSSLEAGLPVERTYRATTFQGTTSQVLILHYDPPGCLRVVDQVLDDSSPTLPPVTHAAIHLSRLDLIDTMASPSGMLDERLMGQEPVDTWCYYYATADLARQRGDWGQIVTLGDRAFQLDDRPNQAEERIPFIEGYAHAGDLERAAELTEEALAHNAGARRPLCHAWERIGTDAGLDTHGLDVVHAIRSDLGCE